MKANHTLLVTAAHFFVKTNNDMLGLKYHGNFTFVDMKCNVIIVNGHSNEDIIDRLTNANDILLDENLDKKEETVFTIPQISAMLTAIEKCKEKTTPVVKLWNIHKITGIDAKSFLLLPVRLDVQNRNKKNAEFELSVA